MDVCRCNVKIVAIFIASMKWVLNFSAGKGQIGTLSTGPSESNPNII